MPKIGVCVYCAEESTAPTARPTFGAQAPVDAAVAAAAATRPLLMMWLLRRGARMRPPELPRQTPRWQWSPPRRREEASVSSFGPAGAWKSLLSKELWHEMEKWSTLKSDAVLRCSAFFGAVSSRTSLSPYGTDIGLCRLLQFSVGATQEKEMLAATLVATTQGVL